MAEIRPYDFQSVVDRIVARLKSKDSSQAWQDTFESSTGLVLAEMVASGIEHLGYYLERRVPENYLDTAIIRSSVYNLASLHGYNPARFNSASASAIMRLSGISDSQYIVPAGTPIGSTTPLTIFNDLVIPPGVSFIGNTDGSTSSQLFESTLSQVFGATLKILIDGVEVASDESSTTGKLKILSGSSIDANNSLVDFAASTITIVRVGDSEEALVYLNGEVLGTSPSGTVASPSTITLKASSLKRGAVNIAVGDDDTAYDIGLVQSIATEMPLGTIDYRSGECSVTLTPADSIVSLVSASYDQAHRFTVIQGTYTSETFEFSPDQLSIDLSPIYDTIDNTHLKIFARNTVSNQKVEYVPASGGFPLFREVDRVYQEFYTHEDLLRIQFGDNKFGRNPSLDGNQLEVSYLISLGLAGNTATNINATFEGDFPRNSINSLLLGYSIDVDKLVGGTNTDSLEQTKINAIQVFQTGKVAVRRKDYLAYAEAFAGIEKASVWAEDKISDSATRLTLRNTVRFSAINANGENIDAGGVGRSSSFIDYMQDLKQATVRIDYLNPTIIPIGLTIQVVLASGSDHSTLINLISSSLSITFHKTYFNFNARLRKSDFSRVVSSISGVEASSIVWTLSGTTPSSDFLEVADLNSAPFSMGLTEENLLSVYFKLDSVVVVDVTPEPDLVC